MLLDQKCPCEALVVMEVVVVLPTIMFWLSSFGSVVFLFFLFLFFMLLGCYYLPPFFMSDGKYAYLGACPLDWVWVWLRS